LKLSHTDIVEGPAELQVLPLRHNSKEVTERVEAITVVNANFPTGAIFYVNCG
jgi:hypothetical protein